MVRFEMLGNFVVEPKIGLRNCARLEIHLRIPPACELLEVDILPALVRWVGLVSFSEVVAIDIGFEGDIFLVRMDRYDCGKNTLA